MPFDGLFAAAVAAELNRALADARIHKIQQPDARTLVLHCRQPGHNRRLLISVEPGYARLHLTETQPPNPPHPPAFCMLLRKHLEPARILHVSTVGLDRIVRIVCEAVDSTGRRARLALIAELTGRHSNVILVEEATGRILDALKRTAPQGGARRALLPGETYEPPPVPPKRDPRRTAREDVSRLLGLQPAPQPVARTIADLYDGFGPFAAREVLLRAGLDPEVRHGQLSPADLERVADALLGLATAAAEGRFQPAIVRDAAGTPVEFWAFPPMQAAGSVELGSSPSAAAAAYYDHRLASLALQREKQRLERLVAAARARLARKADNLRKDLEDAQRADEYRLYGELLTANLHQVPRGAAVTLPNYYAGGEPVTIPLDPALSPADNAQRYFKRYAKARAARIAVQGQLDATLADLAYLDQVALHLDMADSLADLTEIEAELAAAGVAVEGAPPSPNPARPNGAASGDAPKPLEARTTGGARVLIGRNNRQNDRLTLRTAQPDDIWLHVKDLPGAHVILQPQGEVTAADLREAAQLAAYFSKARQSSNVAVDWTRVRHVRKPKGARPGMVIYDHHQTVYVSPDEETVKALLAMSRR
ncbi:MAG TPA: NFACT RNA binding domain-containing protein [Limnochordales bacterium]